MIGYLVSLIPGVGSFVAQYIDVILLVAVAGTLVFIVWHYFAEKRKSKKAMAAGPDNFTDADEAQELVLDSEIFEQHPHPHGRSEAGRVGPPADRHEPPRV